MVEVIRIDSRKRLEQPKPPANNNGPASQEAYPKSARASVFAIAGTAAVILYALATHGAFAAPFVVGGLIVATAVKKAEQGGS